MPIAWYIVPYARDTSEGAPHPSRYCAINDYTTEIYGYGGQWTETEVLGDRAIVKVRARQAILDALDAATGFRRVPKDRLDDPLSDLSVQALKALRDWLLDMGYTIREIHDAFPGGLEDYTLRDYFHFAAQHRLKPRYDESTDTIVCDGIVQGCRSIESVDAEVQE